MRIIRSQIRRQIAVRSPVAVPIATVFAFLVEPANHRLLTGRRIQLLDVGDHDGALSGSMLLRGPLLIRRRVTTRVTSVSSPHVIAGIGEVGGRTRAVVRWTLTERAASATDVSLDAELYALSRSDRLLLGVGARRWIAHLFTETLERLAAALDDGVSCSRAGPAAAGVDRKQRPASRATLDVQVAPSRAR